MNIDSNYQDRLFPYAYNILGSVEDALDTIQDIIIKYLALDKKVIDNEMGYLVKAVINQSVNLKNAKKKQVLMSRRLPEPFAADTADAGLNRDEIISYSMLVLLDKLNARERAIFILKEAFDYAHEDIAAAMSISTENSRTLLRRARIELKRLTQITPLKLNNNKQHLQAYIELIKKGDVKALEKIMKQDMQVITDGGGKIKIVSDFTQGSRECIELLMQVYNTYQSSLSIRQIMINHQPSLIFLQGQVVVNCQVFELDASTGEIARVFSIVDPEKLKSIRIN